MVNRSKKENLKDYSRPQLKDRVRVIKTKRGDWAREVAERVLEFFPDRDVYTCAAGISPSGSVHFGNLRDVMTVLAVKEQLKLMGKRTKIVFSWDDLDRFRKVPAGIASEYQKYIGSPLTSVPDPSGKSSSYARSFEEEFEVALTELLGDEIEYRYQTEEYLSGRYNKMMMLAIQKREIIAEILLQYMTERGKESKGIESESFTKSYYPVSVYSKFTGKDSTEIVNYEDGLITYRCLSENREDTVDLNNTPSKGGALVKLKWKPDWAMRWQAEDVVFEPGGHDHASPGGSYDVSSKIAKEVFDREPPIFTEYKFIGVRGLEGKMSGSKGGAVTPGQLLEIYEPALLKWLYFRYRPNQEFKLAFDSEIYRQYDEFDRALKDYREKRVDSKYLSSFEIMPEIDLKESKDRLPFRQAVAFGQILQWNGEKMDSFLKGLGFEYQRDSIDIRLQKASDWLERYNPEEKLELRTEINRDYVKQLSEEGKVRIRHLHEALSKINPEDLPQKELESALYDIPRSEGLSEEELKCEQRRFFKDVYNLLIGKDTGPRLSTFIWAIGKDRVMNLIDI